MIDEHYLNGFDRKKNELDLFQLFLVKHQNKLLNQNMFNK